MEMNVHVTPDWNQPKHNDTPHTARPSETGAGPIGFTGALRRQHPAAPAGLTTLAASAFADGPTEPMLPATWETGAHTQQPPHSSGEK